MAITFFRISQIIKMHENQIRLFGGESGVRDRGLLESAAAMPMATFDGIFLHEDLYAMAAAYAYHIIQNHPFVDGNKRAGTVVAINFLKINGLKFSLDKQKLEDLMMNVAQGKVKKSQIAEFFRTSIEAVNQTT